MDTAGENLPFTPVDTGGGKMENPNISWLRKSLEQHPPSAPLPDGVVALAKQYKCEAAVQGMVIDFLRASEAASPTRRLLEVLDFGRVRTFLLLRNELRRRSLLGKALLNHAVASDAGIKCVVEIIEEGDPISRVFAVSALLYNFRFTARLPEVVLSEFSCWAPRFDTPKEGTELVKLGIELWYYLIHENRVGETLADSPPVLVMLTAALLCVEAPDNLFELLSVEVSSLTKPRRSFFSRRTDPMLVPEILNSAAGDSILVDDPDVGEILYRLKEFATTTLAANR